MSTPNGAVYEIVLSQRVRDQFQALYERAKAQGTGDQVLAAVRQIGALLRTSPGSFGGPRYTLPHANLEARVGAVPPVLVVYGVHRQRPIVFIRAFLPLPESEL